MRNFNNIVSLNNATEVIKCLQEDPNDRILRYESDLSKDEFDSNGLAYRADDLILVIRSMKAVGASNIPDFFKFLDYYDNTGIIAVIGDESNRNQFGRIIPDDIQKLQNDAEDKVKGRLLSWAGGYEGVCTLSEHPEAEI